MKVKLKQIISILSILSIIIIEFVNQYYYDGFISRGRYIVPLIIMLINSVITFKEKDVRKNKIYIVSIFIFFGIAYSFFIINRPITAKEAKVKIVNNYNIKVNLSVSETLNTRTKMWNIVYNDFPNKYIFNSNDKKNKFIVDTHTGEVEKK